MAVIRLPQAEGVPEKSGKISVKNPAHGFIFLMIYAIINSMGFPVIF